MAHHVFEQIESGECICTARMAPQCLEVCVVAGEAVTDRQVRWPVVFRVQDRRLLPAQANAACDRLERALGRIKPSNSFKVALPELIALRIRVQDITKQWLQGSDRQTPSQADR